MSLIFSSINIQNNEYHQIYSHPLFGHEIQYGLHIASARSRPSDTRVSLGRLSLLHPSQRGYGSITTDDRAGSTCQRYNLCSIGVCYEGGLNSAAKPADTRTPQQKAALRRLLMQLRNLYPQARIVGHRDLSYDRNHDGSITPDEWMKACPCFDVHAEYSRL